MLRFASRETLLSVPRWDFNWQNVYIFEEPIRLPKGTRLHAVAHWDNSRNNPYNPAPEKTVNWGDQLSDEMFFSYFHFARALTITTQPGNRTALVGDWQNP